MTNVINKLSEHKLRLHNNLKCNALATSWLNLELITLRHFGLGLSEPYRSTKDKLTASDALTAPLMNSQGLLDKNHTYFAIPKVTKNAKDNIWSSHKAETYYSKRLNGRPELIIFENIIDLWHAHQFLNNTGHLDDYLLITSSIPDSLPGDWNYDFFKNFKKITVCEKNNFSYLSNELLKVMCRQLFVAELPNKILNWKDLFNTTSNISLFHSIIDNALEVTIDKQDRGNSKNNIVPYPKLKPFNPIDCNGAFHNGNLYYPTLMINEDIIIDSDGSKKIVEQQVTILIRSDRSKHTINHCYSQKGKRNSVLRLSDDTLITNEPTASEHQSWSFDSIEKYLKDASDTPTINQLIHEIIKHLKSTVWLPDQNDYLLLALTVIVSYCMTIFDSVPLVLLTGEKGTGKSEISIALVELSANAVMIGRTSPETIIRTVDSTRGLVALDDMDHLHTSKSTNTIVDNSYLQVIKQSYNKKSAIKNVTKPNGTKKSLNFYGIKVINNTTGIDSITGSRCLHIFTSTIPSTVKEEFTKTMVQKLESTELGTLRDHLHTWVFSNVEEIHQAYQEIKKDITDRTAQIHAPLRTIATILEDSEIIEQLNSSLLAQTNIISSPDLSADQAIVIILENLVKKGYRQLSITHLHLELKKFFKDFPSNTKSPEWIGRKLRRLEIIDDNKIALRKVIRGHKLRFVTLNKDFVITNLKTNITKNNVINPTIFCSYSKNSSCKGCAYQTIKCPLIAAG